MKPNYKRELFTRLLKTWEAIGREVSKTDFIKISDKSYRFIGNVLDRRSTIRSKELENHIEMMEEKLYKCQERVDFLNRNDKTTKENEEAFLYQRWSKNAARSLA